MSSIEHIVIVIPAHNERRRLPATVASINEARDRTLQPTTSTLVVVADACTDRTADAVASLLRPDDLLLEVDLRSVGAARAIGVAAGLTACGRDRRAVWLANTDADTTVPPTWLIDQLELAALGVDAVAGIVELEPTESAAALNEKFARSYHLDLNGTHPHVHGANLGVRADAYQRVGGWAPQSTGEDHDLWNRLRAGGANTCSSTNLRVTTSARRRGRAPKGFARELARLQRSAA